MYFGGKKTGFGKAMKIKIVWDAGFSLKRSGIRTNLQFPEQNPYCMLGK